MSKVFISYRRDDTSGYAHAIHSQLVQHFSKDQVFMDVDTIEPGVDFVSVIEEAVGKCDVLVAIIGKRWVGGEPGGKSRLDNTKDYIRLEVSTALARGIRVIPVLVNGMVMPEEDSLPSPVQPITRRNAIEISNTRFNYDVDQLIAAIRKSLDAAEAKRKANEEEKGNRTQREAEQRRIEADAQRKEEERLREQERQRSEVEARRKADEEKERSRAQREAEERRLEPEAKRKTEAQGLYRQERQGSEDNTGLKAEETNQSRVAYPLAAAVAVVALIIFGFVTLSTRQEPERAEKLPALEMKTTGRKEPIKQRPVNIGELKDAEVVDSTPEKGELGMMVQPARTEGVVVSAVDPASAADEAGIRRGDIILEVNRKRIRNIDEYESALAGIREGKTVLLLVRRGESTLFLALNPEHDITPAEIRTGQENSIRNIRP